MSYIYGSEVNRQGYIQDQCNDFLATGVSLELTQTKLDINPEDHLCNTCKHSRFCRTNIAENYGIINYTITPEEFLSRQSFRSNQ